MNWTTRELEQRSQPLIEKLNAGQRMTLSGEDLGIALAYKLWGDGMDWRNVKKVLMGKSSHICPDQNSARNILKDVFGC